MQDKQEKKVGFISLIGRPSTGKSTLVNTICGYKVSIVSPYPQTTRFLVKGIYNDNDSQIIFIDTPGYHKFNSNLNKSLSNLSIKNLEQGDLILYLVDLTRNYGEEEKEIIEKVRKYNDRLIIAFNKSDLKKDTNIKEIILNELKPKNYIEISAKTGKNIDKLLNLIKENLQFSQIYYPEDFVTDQTIPFRISEIVREKIFLFAKEEVPHSCYVKVEKFENLEDKINANATIFVERESQKGIIIGNKGSMIKKIGENARKDLEQIFEKKVNLFLLVKVHNNWKKDDKAIKKLFNIEDY